MRKRGFTLIELLVVVAIIALLIAILVPSLSKARKMALRSTCAANIKGQMLGVASYMSQFNDKMSDSDQGGWYWDESITFMDLMVQTAISGSPSSSVMNTDPNSIRKI